MRPSDSFVGQPIRSLQSMLRVIGEANGERLTLIPDGIYGQNTIAAVTAFQRRKGLPATGITDQSTWDAIVLEYEPALLLVGEAEPIAVIWEPNEVVKLGQQHPNVYLAQGILTVLSQAYESILQPSFSGEIDMPTSQSILSFQEMNQLPATGELDRITWFQLAKHYPLASRLVVNPQPRVIQPVNPTERSENLSVFRNNS